MRPPYNISSQILKLISSISEKIGAVNANYLNKPSPQLRKQNKVKTIHSSLKIEGNSLSLEQVTDIIENKKVIGSQKDILEVKNAIKVYDNISSFKFSSSKSFLEAHKMLMQGLVDNPGKYRVHDAGIFQDSKILHLAPPAKIVTSLMSNLFEYLKDKNEIALIKSCVFHYEMEFIHPFSDGNGRMGRLWQSVILLNEHPVFEYLPFETLISQSQKKYYDALSKSDKAGNSTKFIEYMLGIIEVSLNELLDYKNKILTITDRLDYFISLGKKEFTRKDYMNVFKNISTATSSRDLKKGIELKYFIKSGDKNKAVYKMKKG